MLLLPLPLALPGRGEGEATLLPVALPGALPLLPIPPGEGLGLPLGCGLSGLRGLLTKGLARRKKPGGGLFLVLVLGFWPGLDMVTRDGEGNAEKRQLSGQRGGRD